MLIKRNRFFLLLFLIFSAPFLVSKFNWLLHSKKTTGTMSFVGHSQSGQIGHVYSVVWFVAGNDTVWFNGNDNILFKPGEAVPVRYSIQHPQDARLDVFPSVWGDTLVYGGIPVLILLAIFLHRGIVPLRSNIKISLKKPFVEIKT